MVTSNDDGRNTGRMRLLSGIYQASAVPTMCVGNENVLLFMNTAMSKLTEYEEREIESVSGWLQTLFAQNGSEALSSQFLTSTEFLEPHELIISLKSGISRCVEVVVFTVAESLVGENVRILQFIDKTEYRVQREVLFVSEHEKSVILDSISEWIILYDSQRVIQWINRAARVNLKAETENIIGKRCYETWCDRKGYCNGCPLLESYATGQPKDSEMTLRDGRVLQIRTHPLRDDHGELQGVFQAIRDVTQYYLAREALKESERFAFGVINALSMNIAVLDEDGIIIAVNRAWRKFALTNPPIWANVNEGANYLAVCDAVEGDGAEQAKAFARGIRDVLSGVRDTCEYEYACHSPREKRWFVGKVSRFRDDGPPRAVVSHEDISRQKITGKQTRTGL